MLTQVNAGAQKLIEWDVASFQLQQMVNALRNDQHCRLQ